MPRIPSSTRARLGATLGLGLGLVAAGVQIVSPPPALANQAGTGLVINEVSAGNGAGTAATDEFVELYNPTAQTITFTGTIQYKSATGTTFSGVSPVTTFVVAPHGYWLAAGANYSGAAIPDSRYAFDASSSTTAGGHIALTGATGIVTAPFSDPLRVDLVGWGTGNFPEGSAAPAHPAVGGSLHRVNGVDTDNNSVDFKTAAVRSPRSSAQDDAVRISDPGDQSLRVGAAITPITFTVTGASAVTYAISAGTLPAGLTLNPTTGTISGTPTQLRAAAPVTVRATDKNGDPVQTTFSLAVVDPTPALEVTGPGPQSLTVGIPDSFSISTADGTAPYDFAVTSGSLPPGLTLGPDGVVSGRPTSARDAADVTVTVTDRDGRVGAATFSIGVGVGALVAVTPTIDDTTPTVGDVLSADAGSWSPAPVTLAYQWLADDHEIVGATSSTLAVTDDLVGAALSVRVTGSKVEYETAVRTSTPTAAVVAPVAPVTVADPGSQVFTVGTALIPLDLTATGGAAPYVFALTSGSLPDGVELDPATGRLSGTPSAVQEPADVTVTVTDADGRTGAVTFSLTVGRGTLATPTPTIDRTTPAVGDVLTADAGTWAPAPVDLAYQWLADGEEIPDATDSSFTVPADVIGARLSVRVTGSRAAYQPASVTSSDTAEVVAPVHVADPGAQGLRVGAAIVPFSLEATGGTAPYAYAVTAGTLPPGVDLDAATGELSGTPTAIADAVRITVTATDAHGRTGSTSFQVVVDVGRLTSGGTPSIDHTRPVVGDELRADGGTWGPTPVTLAYQWLADDEEIPGATSASLTVTSDLVGAELAVRVTGSKAEYGSATVTSPGTSAVVPAVAVSGPGDQHLTVGVPMAPAALVTTGGVAPYTYAVTGGTLPAGLALQPSTGEISGTPTAAAPAAGVTVTATDADGHTGATTITLSVAAAEPTPEPVTTPGTTPGTASGTTPAKPTVAVTMPTVVRNPRGPVTIHVIVDGHGLTGRITVRVRNRRVSVRVVDGVARLRPAQVRKLVRPRKHRTSAPAAGTHQPAVTHQPPKRFRTVRATLSYAGGSAPAFTAPLTIRVRRTP